MSKSDSISDLIINENSNQTEKRLKNGSKRKAPLKPVEVPNLLKNTKVYETTSNLIVTNSKKDPNLNSNSFSSAAAFSHLKENQKENQKKIIFNGKNNTPILLENSSNYNNKIFLNSKNSLNSADAKNSSNDKKDSSLLNAQNESSSALLNNSDYNSSKSSWKFDKNLLDDSSFRKANIKKEKLEINCEKELASGHKKTFSTQTFENNNNDGKIDVNENAIGDSLINNKFIAFSSASRKNENSDLINNKGKIRNNNGYICENNNAEGNSLTSSFTKELDSDKRQLKAADAKKNLKEIENEKTKQQQEEQQKIEDLRNNLMKNSNDTNSSSNKILANLDKNGFVTKNLINMKNLELNKNILQNNNAIISKNSQNNDNTSNLNNNVNPYIQVQKNANSKKNNNPNNNQTKSIKKPENKMNESLSSFKFEFDDEDPLNASTYSNFKKPENEEVFNKIMSHHILMEFHEVHDFLESLGLEKHLDNLLKNGFDDLDKMINGK